MAPLNRTLRKPTAHPTAVCARPVSSQIAVLKSTNSRKKTRGHGPAPFGCVQKISMCFDGSSIRGSNSTCTFAESAPRGAWTFSGEECRPAASATTVGPMMRLAKSRNKRIGVLARSLDVTCSLCGRRGSTTAQFVDDPLCQEHNQARHIRRTTTPAAIRAPALTTFS